jgi:MFS family permease
VATLPPVTAPAQPGMTPAFPVMGAVFLAFLAIGMALPVLPLHVHDVLGFGPTIVGVVAAGQFIAALLTRFWAGRLADRRGAKRAVLLGLALMIAGGLLYLLSLRFLDRPAVSVGILILARTLVGGSESLVITGGMLWGLEVVSPDRSAKVIAWVGMAMFASLAVGAPLGSAVFARFAFLGIAAVTVILPLAALAVVAPRSALTPHRPPQGSVRDVLGPVLLPGLGFALAGITFGAVTAFLTLYFSVQHWPNGALAFSAFAVALIAARLVGGHLPDRLGGARVALWCMAVQAAGLLAVGLAPSSGVAIAGVVVAGAGFSLVFPSLGLEAVQRAAPDQRGLAMGVYSMFIDLTLGLGSPVLGWLASRMGLGAIFVASAVAAVLAMPIAIRLMRTANG